MVLIVSKEVSALKIRIKFAKKYDAKYLGHLDIMRFFQRLFNRADVLMEYSEGFNPHQKLSFAQPLGVGILSNGEYLDAEIKDGQDLDLILSNLNKFSGSGFDILSVKEVVGNSKSMAALRYAKYRIKGDFNFDFSTIDLLLKKNSLVVSKTTKSGTKDVDIRPLIHDLRFENNDLICTVSAASDNNLKADTLLSVLCNLSNNLYNKNNFIFIREDLLADNFVSLENFQTV